MAPAIAAAAGLLLTAAPVNVAGAEVVSTGETTVVEGADSTGACG
jgi:hypothetical protein